MLKNINLQKISVIGMGLLGASVTMACRRAFPKVFTVGYSHRASTRKKSRQLNVAHQIAQTLEEAVHNADIVILATPILTFETYFKSIAPFLKSGAIVTDVGSTKHLVHQWANKNLPRTVFYVGSHPIAGSEKRGVEYARDDLLTSARCILTHTARTNAHALKILRHFWSELGCNVVTLAPKKHDQIFALISHLPHVLAAALINGSDFEDMKFAGKGFIDTSRIASGPADVWMDIVLTNHHNITLGIDQLVRQLGRMKKAIAAQDAAKVKDLLETARAKREKLIAYKLKKRELL
ncbi:MAG: prephenate dehydrogenase/arogenate dehydrogenase family protein [Sedimentisphaerales bacterium]|nr:prephenate dehydrogenase/arogenate dehydrogenase family protein [Sedimentisphaerales bacterium]